MVLVVAQAEPEAPAVVLVERQVRAALAVQEPEQAERERPLEVLAPAALEQVAHRARVESELLRVLEREPARAERLVQVGSALALAAALVRVELIIILAPFRGPGRQIA